MRAIVCQFCLVRRAVTTHQGQPICEECRQELELLAAAKSPEPPVPHTQNATLVERVERVFVAEDTRNRLKFCAERRRSLAEAKGPAASAHPEMSELGRQLLDLCVAVNRALLAQAEVRQ